MPFVNDLDVRWGRLLRCVRDALWAVRHRVDPRHRYHMVNTGLAPGYYDTDERILHACMSLLVAYVERECGGEEAMQKWTDELRSEPDPYAPAGAVNSQADRQEETLAIYRWWKVQRPADRQREDDWMMEIWGGSTGSRDPEERQRYRDFEQANEDRDQEMLHRLIEVRRSLWT